MVLNLSEMLLVAVEFSVLHSISIRLEMRGILVCLLEDFVYSSDLLDGRDEYASNLQKCLLTKFKLLVGY